MLYKLQANGYKFSWLLIPISVPFVWLLFAWKRHFRAYDHAIFVTYSIAFMSLFFIALSLAIKAGAPEWLYGTLLFLISTANCAALTRSRGFQPSGGFWCCCSSSM